MPQVQLVVEQHTDRLGMIEDRLDHRLRMRQEEQGYAGPPHRLGPECRRTSSLVKLLNGSFTANHQWMDRATWARLRLGS